MIFLGCQLEIPQEEGLLIEELPLPDWPLGMSRNTDCVDCQLVTEGLAHHGWYNAQAGEPALCKEGGRAYA